MVRSQLKPIVRWTLEALIVLDVHARDVTKSLIEKNINDKTEFMWLA